MTAPSPRWHDDWYVIEEIAPGVHAIGEPKYHQLNWSYLIQGSERALLFDTGPGERNIRPAVEFLTKKPVTVLPSHLHFDHVGGLKHFESVAFADLPLLRGFERGGLIHAPESYVLGEWENRFWTPVRAGAWLPIGSSIDLGGLSLQLIHTPGHSPESVSLYARQPNILLATDFIYPGPLYAQIPNASLPDYLETAKALENWIDADTVILCGHGDTPESPAPRMTLSDIHDVASALAAIRDGKSQPVSREPMTFPVNGKMTFLASEASFGTWQIPK